MKTLLIADDEIAVRRLVRMTLEDDDYYILEAGDGETALEMVREHQPELVLLDVMMPKRTGIEVCRELKQDDATSDTRVVMLTARAQEADEDEGRAAGADGYFRKPFSPIALLEKVDEMLGRNAS